MYYYSITIKILSAEEKDRFFFICKSEGMKRNGDSKYDFFI